jgi:hypothetical protein
MILKGYGSGWFRESYRHSLAARGVTSNRYSFKAKQLNGIIVARTRHGIPVTIRGNALPGTAWPISPSEIVSTLDKVPTPVITGIKEINMRNPGPAMTKQPFAYAQYVRSDPPRINIFPQKFNGREFVDVDPGLNDPAALNKYMKNYVLVHEPAHHFFQHNLKMNSDPVLTEEARVDLFVKGGNPFDKMELEKEKKLRVVNYGPTGSV